MSETEKAAEETTAAATESAEQTTLPPFGERLAQHLSSLNEQKNNLGLIVLLDQISKKVSHDANAFMSSPLMQQQEIPENYDEISRAALHMLITNQMFLVEAIQHLMMMAECGLELTKIDADGSSDGEYRRLTDVTMEIWRGNHGHREYHTKMREIQLEAQQKAAALANAAAETADQKEEPTH